MPRALGWIAELMPIRFPSRLRSAPPELPWLIEASVWMRFRTVKPEEMLAVRLSADTMPTVTLSPRPYGLPIAMAVSPIMIPHVEHRPT